MVVSPFHLRTHLGEHFHHSYGNSLGSVPIASTSFPGGFINTLALNLEMLVLGRLAIFTVVDVEIGGREGKNG